MATGGNDIETDADPFIPSDREIFQLEDYKHLMGSDLKLDNFEILLISHEDDYSLAKKVKHQIETKVTYSFGDTQIQPKVELHRELVYASDELTPEIDFSLRKTLVVFALATKSFSEDPLLNLESRASMDKVINNENKYKQSYFVVHTKPKGKRDYELPSISNTVKSLDFSENESENVRFYERVAFILQSRANIQNEKNRELSFERLQFLKEKHPKVHTKLTNGRSFRCQTQINKHQLALDQCTQNISQSSVRNNFSVPASMVPCDPNGDTQVDADTGKENPVDHESHEQKINVINPSESDSSYGSDPGSVDEETFPKVFMKCLTVAKAEGEDDDIEADNGAFS